MRFERETKSCVIASLDGTDRAAVRQEGSEELGRQHLSTEFASVQHFLAATASLYPRFATRPNRQINPPLLGPDNDLIYKSHKGL